MSTQLIEKVRNLVIQGGMSKSGLARASGLHANTLRDLEAEDWNPTAETLRKLETFQLRKSSKKRAMAACIFWSMMKTARMKAI
jgi:transcriptional regulator with XRE-family HTH domain